MGCRLWGRTELGHSDLAAAAAAAAVKRGLMSGTDDEQ